MEQRSQSGSWASGYDWHLTSHYATFFGVQGEVIYVLGIWFPFPNWITFKLFLLFLLFAVIIRVVFGYNVRRFYTRMKRFWVGRQRPIYDAHTNFLRMKIGD